MNPTLLVLKSMSAYLEDYAHIEVVPDLKSVTAKADLVLEPVVTSIEWRTNRWRYGYFAERTEVRLELILRDHTNVKEESFESGWVTGGMTWRHTPSGIAKRVVRAVAGATATVLNEADVVDRLARSKVIRPPHA
jgi:hypothetical protein